MKKTVIFLLMFVCSITGLSQVQSAFYANKNALQHYAKIKTSSSLSKSIPVKNMQPFDVATLKASQPGGMTAVPFRFGFGFDVDYTLDDGVWETGDSNTRVPDKI
jgi:hypothetical protein